MREAMDEANATYEDTVSSTMATANVADRYITKLQELEAAGLDTAEEQRQYQNTLALLLQVMPSLSDSISQTTDEYGRATYTLNTTTEALRANTNAWMENARQQAYQEYMTTLYSEYADVLLEAEKNSIGLTEAQSQLEDAQRRQAEIEEQMAAAKARANKQAEQQYRETGILADATAYLTRESLDLENAYYDVKEEVLNAQASIDAYEEAIQEGADATAAAEAEINLAAQAMGQLTKASDESAESFGRIDGQAGSLQATMSAIQETVGSLSTAYAEAYDAALESISGQYQLWDEAAGVVATSAGSINSALESQITYWQNYNANLQTLTERSSDIAGLSEMIASFADGSQESVNAIAGMAGATDEQLATMVSNWKALQAEQKAAAGSVADLKTDFTAAMDELLAELVADIEAMDLGQAAEDSARATILGYVNGAEEMLPQVQAAYSRVAQAAIDAVDAKLEIHSPSRVMEEKANMTWAG